MTQSLNTMCQALYRVLGDTLHSNRPETCPHGTWCLVLKRNIKNNIYKIATPVALISTIACQDNSTQQSTPQLISSHFSTDWLQLGWAKLDPRLQTTDRAQIHMSSL